MSAAADRLRPSNRWLLCRDRRCCWRCRSACRSFAIAAGRRSSRRIPTLWLQSGPLPRAGWRWVSTTCVADVYWIRAVVYYGGKRRAAPQHQRPANFDQLYPLLDLVTSLDPHFKVAYRFGAIFLTEAYPSGPGRPDLAIALLRARHRARRRRAGSTWRTSASCITGGCTTIKQAAEWFKRAGEQPGAPTWLAPLAATTLAAGRRSPIVALSVDAAAAEHRHRMGSPQRTAAAAAARCDGHDRRAESPRRSDSSRASSGRRATGASLATAERLRGIPLDPTGTPYRARCHHRAHRSGARIVAVAAAVRNRRQPRRRDRDRPSAARRRGVVRTLHRQLPERRHLSPAAGPVAGDAAVALP